MDPRVRLAGDSIGTSHPCESRREVQILRKSFLAGLSLLVYGAAECIKGKPNWSGRLIRAVFDQATGEGGASQEALLLRSRLFSGD